MVKTTFLPEGIEIVFADQKDDKLANEVNSPYIVTVKSHIDIKDIDNFNLTSKGILYGDVMGKHTMFNQIKVAKGDADAEGEKLGYFKEHHKYYDKVDGKLRENPTFIIDSSTDEGIAEETYTTSKNEIGSYKFIRIDEDALVENPVYNENGEKATGNFEEEKTKEVTYIYVREVTSGSFQEHHIYQTVDEDDNVISTDDTVNKDETRGIDEDSYKTSKIDRDGYTLTEVRATNDESAELGVKFDSKGAETTGNYVNGKKLEVTYIYQKEEQQPVEKKGSFQEHHIYQTKKLDGTIVEDSRDDKEVKEGTEKENYKTSKQDKEGYTLTKIESTNGGQFNEDGSLKEAAYIADKKQEVTYIYQKEEQETPWTPLEPSTPVDPSEPSEPEEPKHTTPLVPLTPAEEVEVERITHHDHKTLGTPVVTEVPSTPVVETEKSVEEKTEETEETKEVENKEEKAEKVEEVKEEAKTVEDDNLEKPQAPENYDKLAPRAPEKDKAPKTGDAGILSSLGLGSLAASGLAFIELKKRNKKNK